MPLFVSKHGPKAGLIVLQEWWGVNEQVAELLFTLRRLLIMLKFHTVQSFLQIKQTAADLAKASAVRVAVPDLYRSKIAYEVSFVSTSRSAQSCGLPQVSALSRVRPGHLRTASACARGSRAACGPTLPRESRRRILLPPARARVSLSLLLPPSPVLPSPPLVTSAADLRSPARRAEISRGDHPCSTPLARAGGGGKPPDERAGLGRGGGGCPGRGRVAQGPGEAPGAECGREKEISEGNDERESDQKGSGKGGMGRGVECGRERDLRRE